MALFNVTTANNTLLATASTANCESEIINQDVGDTDFESIRDTRVHWRLNNISGAGSTADTCASTVPISENDRIFIRKNDGSLYDTIAQGVTTSTSPTHPNMTSNTLPEGVCSDSQGHSDTYKAFDSNDSTSIADHISANEWVQYQFKNNEPTQILSYYLKMENTYDISWNIEGSLDGINFSTISTEPSQSVQTGKIFQIESPGFFSYYRIKFTYIQYGMRLQTFSLLDSAGTSFDTSAVTQGEVPDQVFKFTDTVSFNGGGPAIQKDIFYEYGTSGSKLAVTSLYNDYLLSGRTLKTRFDFTSSGNEVVEVTGQIYKVV